MRATRLQMLLKSSTRRVISKVFESGFPSAGNNNSVWSSKRHFFLRSASWVFNTPGKALLECMLSNSSLNTCVPPSKSNLLSLVPLVFSFVLLLPILLTISSWNYARFFTFCFNLAPSSHDYYSISSWFAVRILHLRHFQVGYSATSFEDCCNEIWQRSISV